MFLFSCQLNLVNLKKNQKILLSAQLIRICSSFRVSGFTRFFLSAVNLKKQIKHLHVAHIFDLLKLIIKLIHFSFFILFLEIFSYLKSIRKGVGVAWKDEILEVHQHLTLLSHSRRFDSIKMFLFSIKRQLFASTTACLDPSCLFETRVEPPDSFDIFVH